MEKKVPEIRFKGFSGEWDEIQLNDEVTIINGRAYSQDELQDKGKYPVLRVGNFYTNTSWYYSDMELGEKYYANYGDLLYTWSASFGPHIWNGEKVIYHYHIWKLELSENMDKLFLLQLLDYDREKILSGSSGSTMIHITKSGMESKIAFIPKKPEQSVIGNYFQKLDSLIHQHQQKHDQLSNIKKAMLEKMFPKPGETIPEIRFKGFSGEWEEKELNKISDKITEKNTSVIYSETFTNSAEFGIVSQRDYFDKDISNSNNIGGYYVVQPEDFVYNPRISTFSPCGPIKRNALGRAGVMSPLYTVFRTKGVNTIFIEYIFQTNLWHTFMFLNGDTGARADRFSIKDSVFFELPLLLPTVNEQTAISNYFQKLDALINQHQQQITKLTHIKQACLSKMFV